MKSFVFLILCVFAATRRGPPSTSPNVIQHTYSVEFQKSVDALKILKTHFSEIGIDYTIRTHVTSIKNTIVSFSLNSDYDENLHVSNIPHSLHYFTVSQRSRPEITRVEDGAVPEYIHEETGVLAARSLGITGKGIKVAVIDSGIYYIHPALGGGFGPGFKVGFGYDFVGDDFDGWKNTVTVPDDDPLDSCSGMSHGTHVAGIIGGDATGITKDGFVSEIPFTGVAPNVTLGAYRIFGCKGLTSSDLIAAAIYKAAEDGADVINVSIGAGPKFSNEVDAVAIDYVSKLGIIVTTSSGNDGNAGPYVVSNPGIALGALAVASFNNLIVPAPFVLINDQRFKYALLEGNSSIQEGEVFNVIINDLTAFDNDLDEGLEDVPSINATGSALLVYESSRGLSRMRCEYAHKAGASLCILLTNTTTVFAAQGSYEIPGINLNRDAGKYIISEIRKGNLVSIKISFKDYPFLFSNGGSLSTFSSAGLDNELFMKPDIGGIGGRVYSTVSPFAAKTQGFPQAYGFYDGTSMASPFVAGCMALLIEAKGKQSFEKLKGYIQNHAVPKPILDTKVLKMKDLAIGALYSPAYQGAGLVNIFNAVKSQTVVLPSVFSLNDTKNLASVLSFTIWNEGIDAVQYQIRVVRSSTVHPFNPDDDFILDGSEARFTNFNAANLSFVSNNQTGLTIIINPNSNFTVEFTISAADSNLYEIYGGYINIKSTRDDIYVPYVGVLGDWSKRAIWSRKSESLYKKWFKPTCNYRFGTIPEMVATGLYSDSNFSPLKTGEIVNATLVAASTSRFAKIEIEYTGNDDSILEVLQTMNFNGTLSILDFTARPKAKPEVSLWETMTRATYFKSHSITVPPIYKWDGRVFGDQLFRLPGGKYRMKFLAKRYFDGGWDSIVTPDFLLVY